MRGRFSLSATLRVGQLCDLPNWPDTPPLKAHELEWAEECLPRLRHRTPTAHSGESPRPSSRPSPLPRHPG
jgi:hypothetical protein